MKRLLMRFFTVFALCGFALTAVRPTVPVTGSPTVEHERLRIRNNFAKPEEVVAYYCGRDASGFVWSGLLDIERRAFTLWDEIPDHDSFYIASNYEIRPARIAGSSDQAEVDVHYQVLAIGDGHGTRAPASSSDYRVRFNLRRVAGSWKIASPAPRQLAPVVIESKFQYASP